MKVADVKDFETFSCFFKGEKGHRRAEFVIRLLAIDKVNRLYDHSGAYSGSEFTSRLLDELGVNYVVGNADRLRSLPEGSFITVSNHPYGGLDGIISIDLLAGIRPDYKFMVNKILSLVRTLNGNFISVTPTGNKKTGVTGTSIKGIRETLEHLHNGHPVGFFPSGAVSDFSLRDLRVRDRKWQESILHVIHSVKVPILPIHFFDKNSPLFYFLGLINWRIRLLRLPSELLNKKGKKPRIGIGNIISAKEQAQFSSPEALGVFLRKAIYEMPLPDTFVPRKNLKIREYKNEKP
jgi:putative hemolysin